MKLKHFLLTVGITAIFASSCSDDDDSNLPLDGTIALSVSQAEFSEDVGTVTLNFSSTETFTSDLQISYSVSGTATSDSDYQALSGTATLSAGETVLSETLVIIDDGEVEGNETIIITLTGVEGLEGISFSQQPLTLTILDNDSFPFENGILVVHEGNFFAGNASISFVSMDLSEVRNGIFAQVNDTPNWGDIAQSMAFHGDLAYIVVNNSQKVEVVNRYTFESVATIGGAGSTDFLNPRYMAVVDGKGYLTNWGDGTDPDDDYIAVIDLTSNTVETTIAVEEGPERVLAQGNKVYVAHQGGYNQNNMISVIDVTDHSVETITVGDVPNSMQLDNNGTLWVLCGGNPSYAVTETAGSLVKVDTGDLTVSNTFTFEAAQHPDYLSMEGDDLYFYLNGSVFQMGIGATALPLTAEITGLNFYDMTVMDGRLYAVDAKDFTSNGSLEVYDLSDNSKVESIEVSPVPGEIYFNGTP